jgi:hypothetical protein
LPGQVVGPSGQVFLDIETVPDAEIPRRRRHELGQHARAGRRHRIRPVGGLDDHEGVERGGRMHAPVAGLDG